MSQEASDSNSAPASTGEGAAGWVQGFSPLPTGSKAGELVIQSVLGAGEFAITYLTEHEKRSKRYVLKEYLPRAIAYRDGPTLRARAAQSTTFTWGLDRFLAEARSLQKIKHPAIISVHGVIEMGGSGYVGMAYEAGQDFGIWLHEHKRIAPQEALDKLLAPLLQGLELAHAINVFHLDLGPECIIVHENGTPVLVDFGMFRVGLRRRLGTASTYDRPHAAPELLSPEGGPVGAWTDIYSLAALLYLAVSGKSPPSARDRSDGKTMTPAAAAAQGRYRAEFLSAIDAGLQLAPQARPQSIGDWRDQLLRTPASRIGASKTVPSKPVTQVPVMQKPSTRVAAVTIKMPNTPDEAAEATPASALAAEPAAAAVTPPGRATFSALDESLDRATDTASTRDLMENKGFRGLFLGIAGLLGGGVAGALSSVVVASILNPECGGDNCVRPFVMPLAVVGALIGTWVGIRHAAASRPGDKAERPDQR